MPTIAAVFTELSALPNFQLWLSADAETGSPADVPEGVSVAYMQTDLEEETEDADLVFLDHPPRKLALPLNVLE